MSGRNGTTDPAGSAKSAQSDIRKFWDSTGLSMPPFFGAPSTRYYFECERMIFERFAPDLGDRRLVKTDLWDEAKNTRILNWAAGQGAETYAIDISTEIIRGARAGFPQEKSRGFIASDVRQIGFKDDTFDLLYSMGTVEHFREYEKALRECRRVLKPGGTAIIGVPNKADPFLRPLLVAFLNSVGLYGYGYEKSFTRKRLEKMLTGAGFQVKAGSGILFMPGWLRLADLFIYVRWPRLKFLIAPFIAPFAWLYKKFPILRRHGYLIFCVVEKPRV